MTNINTLREKSLHASLKTWYAQPGDLIEEKVDGFFIDIVRDDLLIEIQTKSFGSIKKKLFKLLKTRPIRLVHPIAQDKWRVRIDADGETILNRRKSPKHGRIEDLFDELVRFPELMVKPNFEIEVLLVQSEEHWINDGKGSWRRRRWSRGDVVLLDVVDRVMIYGPDELHALVPDTLPRPFTNKALARALGIRDRLAQKMTYCLRHMGALTFVGKQSRSFLYE